MAEKRTIWILLSRHRDWRSNIIYYMTGRKYTHASISIDKEWKTFYSFNIKGFCRENPRHFRSTDEGGEKVLYELTVSGEQYQLIKDRIDQMNAERKKYHYSQLGVLLCFLHIPHKLHNQYFCSQFVAELLRDAGVVQSKKNPSVTVPNTFIKEFQDNEYVSNIIMSPVFA